MIRGPLFACSVGYPHRFLARGLARSRDNLKTIKWLT